MPAQLRSSRRREDINMTRQEVRFLLEPWSSCSLENPEEPGSGRSREVCFQDDGHVDAGTQTSRSRTGQQNVLMSRADSLEREEAWD